MNEKNNQDKLSNRKIEDIKRLIALREEQEQRKENNEKFAPEQYTKLQRLSLQYKGYAELTSEQMQEQLEKESHTTGVGVDINDDNKSLLDAYKDKYKNADWYQEPQKNDRGQMELNFPTEEDAAQFFSEQAEKGKKFKIVDLESNKVMAYSNGDGTLYHSNGNEVQKGDLLQPGERDSNDFKLSEPSEPPRPNP